jgi:Fibronectin type III domain
MNPATTSAGPTAPVSRRRRRTIGLGLLAVLLAAVASVVAVNADAATSHAPVGHYGHVAQVPGGLQVSGWALDPDTKNAIQVDVWVDGHRTRVTATRHNSSETAKYRSAWGVQHGFVVALKEKAGRHEVCVHAMNPPSDKTFTQLGCKFITLNFNPGGSIAVRQSATGVTATGWTVDPDAPTTSLAVALTVDGVQAATGTATTASSAAAKARPGAGTKHGYSLTAATTEGKHTVCVVATNVSYGANASLGCKAITVNFSPVGAITTLAQSPGGFHVRGWVTDPDTTAAISVIVSADGTALDTATAASSAATGHGAHGFSSTFKIGTGLIKPGTHRICVEGINAGPRGKNRSIACKTISLNFNPTAKITATSQVPTAAAAGAVVTGWASDPDTTAPVTVSFTVDGTASTSGVVAKAKSSTHSGHAFSVRVPITTNGTHTVCAVATNLAYGLGNSPAGCRTVALNFNPYGAFTTVTRASTTSTNLRVVGWAVDPNTSSPISISTTIDGIAAGTRTASVARTDVAAAHAGAGSAHGFSTTFTANTNEHKVCVTAVNVSYGTGNTSLGCKIINAVHPKVTSVPRTAAAVAGYGGATVTWVAPVSDGGAPWSSYTVTASPGGVHATVGATATTATVIGLKPKTAYTFSVVAHNVAGASTPAVTAKVTTQASPPPQTSPAPISTSRYVRNIKTASASDLAAMRAEGVADARANPSGHGYLILLDIGGQDQADHGVVLSAGVRFVSYTNLVADVNAYVDGYASAQRVSAPVTIAVGTNNDMDVSTASGTTWANTVVDPIVSHAKKYTGLTIAGANDIEPGFDATYAQTKAWLNGYLAATKAPFVFNGSADGCAWTVTNRGCNNGWTMAGLYNLSGGAAPVRIIGLPQIYNDTMAAQWKYISLTGIAKKLPKINFGGALTEWTACDQAGSCGSLTGKSAWSQLWSQLRSSAATKPTSLPYSTDLRIDR